MNLKNKLIPIILIVVLFMGIFSIVFASTFAGFLSGIKNLFFKSEDWKNVDTSSVVAIQSYHAQSEYVDRLDQGVADLGKDMYEYSTGKVDTKKLDTLNADDWVHGDGMFDLGSANTTVFSGGLFHIRENYQMSVLAIPDYKINSADISVYCGESSIDKSAQTNSYETIVETELKKLDGYKIYTLTFGNTSLLLGTYGSKTKYIPDFYFDKVKNRIIFRCDKDF